MHVIVLRLIEIQQIALATVGIPFVWRTGLPAVKATLALIMIIEPAKHKTVFNLVECLMDFQFGILCRQPEIDGF